MYQGSIIIIIFFLNSFFFRGGYFGSEIVGRIGVGILTFSRYIRFATELQFYSCATGKRLILMGDGLKETRGFCFLWEWFMF